MPRPAASPGLLRRRYSVPETIMRKYRLAQQSADSEEPCAATSPSSTSPPVGACGGCVGSGARRGDRELMRKSALLRRLWGRAPAPAPRASRSLHGSSSELRRSPAGSGWTSPKRQRLEGAAPPEPAEPRPEPGAGPSPRSDCTFASHRAPSPAARARPDVFARYSELAGDAARRDSARALPSRSTTDSTETLSDSLPTALEARPDLAPVPEPLVPDLQMNQYTSLPFEVSSPGSPPFEVLEIVVSETVDAPRAQDAASPRRAGAPARSNINIDEYVSNILVESLNSLSEQLESMSAAVGGAGVVVEKEIKVRLQNTGVNTIVHLSPTSNHQIIFGNEELHHADNRAPRDACNNPRGEREPNNNDPPEAVNRAVLRQIQKLFHDELHRLDPGVQYPGEPTLARLEVSDVDLYLHAADAGPPDADAPVGVGAGNYWLHAEPALVSRACAPPHSASMEVNTSSDAEPSACTSLVDSLDDPASPRAAPPAPPPRRLVRSAVDVLDLLPEGPASPPSPPRDRAEAFFVPITDDDGDGEKENVVVADRMPDRIRERLLRRQRKRELRLECARRGRGRNGERERRRDAERDARQVVAALVDELIAKIAQDEYKCMRIRQRAARDVRASRNGGASYDEHDVRAEMHALRGKLSQQPAGEPRRFYQKSEIHDGDKCIEILEILEYVDDSQNSPETTNSDERHSSSKGRKSRIPIPVYERVQRTSTLRSRRSEERHRSPPPAPSPSPPPARRASVPPAAAPAEPRARAGSLRFRRVFDIIPEERSGPVEEPAAPGLPPALPAPPARATRCAATSPPAVSRASRSTMTSPRRAAPASPPAPAPAPPRVAAGSNGNLNEKRVKSESSKQRRGREPARAAAPPPGPAAPPPPPPPPPPHERDARRSSSSESDSGGSSLLCAAPRWLAARRRRPRLPRAARAAPARAPHRALLDTQTGASESVRAQASDSAGPASARGGGGAGGAEGAGGWSVTVAGSCRAALPADVEMRLRFPREPRAPRAPRAAPAPAPRADPDNTPRRSVATRSDETGTTEGWCRCCSCGAPPAPRAPPAPPALPAPPRSRRASLSLSMRKDDSSGLARKSRKKSSQTHLPELEPARGGGGVERRRLSGKMRRACSLHCWLPAAAPRRAACAGELAVEGSAIVPERKPRAPSMSERDLTRRATPRLCPRHHCRHTVNDRCSLCN